MFDKVTYETPLFNSHLLGSLDIRYAKILIMHERQKRKLQILISVFVFYLTILFCLLLSAVQLNYSSLFFY